MLGSARDVLLQSSSALQPLLWLCLCVTPLCFLLAASIDHGIRWVFAVVGILPIVFILLNYYHWRKEDPDRLHSEKFQLRLEELRIIESKSGEIITDPAKLDLVEAPMPTARALEKEAD